MPLLREHFGRGIGGDGVGIDVDYNCDSNVGCDNRMGGSSRDVNGIGGNDADGNSNNSC